jgi:hypothetical protein
VHHRPPSRSHPALWPRILPAIAVCIAVLCLLPTAALADAYSWGIGGNAPFTFDALDRPFSVAADGSLTFQYTGVSGGQAAFHADSAGFDVPFHGEFGVKKTFETLTCTRSNDVRGVDLGFFYKTTADGNWLPVQGTLFGAYAGGNTLWYRVRVTVDTSQPMPLPLTITMITVTYGDYVPLPKVPTNDKSKKSDHTATRLGPGVYHYPAPPSGAGSGSGSGTGGSGSGSGTIPRGGATGSSGVGLATSAASHPTSTAPSGSLPAPTPSAVPGATLVQGYQLMEGDGAVASITGGGRAAAAGGSSAPLNGGHSGTWGFILAATLVVALLAAPGPILSRRRRQLAAFGHFRPRPHRPYRPLG